MYHWRSIVLSALVKNFGAEVESGAHALEEQANKGQAGIKNAISGKMSEDWM